MKKCLSTILTLGILGLYATVCNAEEAAPETAETAVEAGEEELIIPNGDKNIYGILYKPAENANGSVIIISHGYNGSHNDWVDESTLFAEKGYMAYAYDFCGGSARSKSSGKTTEMTITSEKEDLKAVIDYFKSLDGVRNIYLLGGSQGGLVSSLVSAEKKEDIKALAMYFPALCVPEDWEKNYPDPSKAPDTFDFWGMELSREFVEDVHKIDVFSIIGDYERDVLILHGDEDAIVPYEYSEKAAGIYEKAELIRMEGEGHGWSPEGGKKAMELVLGFFNAH